MPLSVLDAPSAPRHVPRSSAPNPCLECRKFGAAVMAIKQRARQEFHHFQAASLTAFLKHAIGVMKRIRSHCLDCAQRNDMNRLRHQGLFERQSVEWTEEVRKHRFLVQRCDEEIHNLEACLTKQSYQACQPLFERL